MLEVLLILSVVVPPVAGILLLMMAEVPLNSVVLTSLEKRRSISLDISSDVSDIGCIGNIDLSQHYDNAER